MSSPDKGVGLASNPLTVIGVGTRDPAEESLMLMFSSVCNLIVRGRDFSKDGSSVSSSRDLKTS